LLVFDKTPLNPHSDDVIASHADGADAGVSGGGGVERGGRGLVWPEDGAALPELGVLDVEWTGRARGDLSRRVRARDEGALREEPLEWHSESMGECAEVLVDGEVRGRVCGGAAEGTNSLKSVS